MKNIVFLAIILINSIAFSQSEDKKKEKVKPNFYVGIGIVNQKFNLNEKLNSSNVPLLNETQPEFTFGINIFGEKYSGDIELASTMSVGKNANSEHIFTNGIGRLRFHYNVVNKEKIGFTTGGNIGFSRADARFYSVNNTVDLNNLQPSNNFGEFSLYNNVFFAGPSAALYLRKDKKFKIRVNLGYEFAISNGKWKSDFATVNNTVKESGNNRFIFGISLL
jgi:hypothetical protein